MCPSLVQNIFYSLDGSDSTLESWSSKDCDRRIRRLRVQYVQCNRCFVLRCLSCAIAFHGTKYNRILIHKKHRPLHALPHQKFPIHIEALVDQPPASHHVADRLIVFLSSFRVPAPSKISLFFSLSIFGVSIAKLLQLSFGVEFITIGKSVMPSCVKSLILLLTQKPSTTTNNKTTTNYFKKVVFPSILG